MSGCLKGLGRLALVLALVVAGAVAWWYREPILAAASRWLGPKRTALPPVADTAVGAPTPGAVATAREKIAALGRPGGADSVVLTPNEVASLIGGGIDWTVRKTFDSLRVELLDGTVAVHCRLDTRRLPQEALGPLGGALEPREPLRLAGPLTIERPGLGRWTIRELSLRGFPLPPPLVRTLAARAAGADSTGSVPVILDPAVARVRVYPTGVVLYRRGVGGGGVP